MSAPEYAELKQLAQAAEDTLNAHLVNPVPATWSEHEKALDAFRSYVEGKDILDILGQIEQLAARVAELERWQDPDSAERQALQEKIIFSLGEGSRSEIDLRESQLAQSDTALYIARARIAALEADLRKAKMTLESSQAEVRELLEKKP